MRTIHNERLKPSATFLNGLAIAIFAIGAVTPVIQAMRAAMLSPREWRMTLVIALLCLGGSVVLHSGGRFLLGGLKE